MNLDQIETKCFILALFVRDDGERFLLGSRMFEFVDSQLHFAANAYQNDIVEVQGNDGIMLAGQVRRSSSQAFDGYIGDSSVERATIEQNRRDFFKFFRKNHYYKVVYILPNGSAIQRRQGFIVEAPEVRELYQLFPKYHISMNFEDINYYNYEEDSEGEEIYGESATLKVATAATGGLIWEDGEETPLSGEGTNFTVNGTIDGNPLTSVELKGDTTQQTYSGKNLIYPTINNTTSEGILWTSSTALGTFTVEGTAAATYSAPGGTFLFSSPLPAGTYTLSTDELVSNARIGIGIKDTGGSNRTTYAMSGTNKSVTFTTTVQKEAFDIYLTGITAGATVSGTFKLQLESGSSPTSWEPYVGGVASPNPSYPQDVNTVTGRQLVTISDGDSQAQTYEVNLGKNLLPVTMSSQTLNDVVFTVNADKSITMSGLASARTEPRIYQSGTGVPQVILKAGVTYHNSMDVLLYLYTGSYRIISNNGNYTPTSDEVVQYAYIRVENGESVNTTIYPQLEKGSTATSYAPYFTPIELCKIGTHQDYIYKDNGDWYIHKETGSIVYSSSDITSANSYSNIIYVMSNKPTDSDANGEYGQKEMFCTHATATNTTGTWNSTQNIGKILSGASQWTYWFGFAVGTTLAQMQTALDGCKVYYVLKTPTNTQITNADLIAQLEALLGATTYDSVTIFNVDGQLQAILSVSLTAINGGGVVWDEYGATWEEGTGGGPTMIDIESIDNVYPVWELTGPAVNPQISILTTNTTLTYTGSITASQTLQVDMFNKTATLNGTSVVGNISGDWVYLKPGINRVTYTATNADAAESTIWWQEIVG